MSSKFKFPIYKDRVYTLDYEGFSIEVSGEEILSSFRRAAHLENMFKDPDWRANE